MLCNPVPDSPATMQSSLTRQLGPPVRPSHANPGRQYRPGSFSLSQCRAEAAPPVSVGRAGPYTGRDPEVKKPAWLRQRAAQGEKYVRMQESLGELKLNTVYVEAQCPNIGKCWNRGGGDGIATATIMVLGDTCVRGCRFCTVKTSNKPPPPDPLEPVNMALAAVSWGSTEEGYTKSTSRAGADHVSYFRCISKLKQIEEEAV